MIARRTIITMLLAMLVGLGMLAWRLQHRDDCDRMGAGRVGTPVSVDVKSGSQIVAVPCSVWVVRQPRAMQAIALFEVALVVVFVISAVGDYRRRRRGAQW